MPNAARAEAPGCPVVERRSSDSRVEFVEPRTLLEAEAQKRRLSAEIEDIMRQLDTRRKMQIAQFNKRRPRDTNGPWKVTQEEREESIAHKDWFRRATTALRARERVLKLLDMWINATRKKRPDPTKLINAAHDLFVKLRDEDVEFDPEEWALVEQMETYLRC